jgi:TonB-dependent receptor
MGKSIRRHPLATAISISLLALLATSTAAAAQDAPPMPDSSQIAQAPPAAPTGPASASSAAQPATLGAVQVVGVRASQMRAVQLKRAATSIQDSISAVDIGELPDATITDSLQRITGVQINRDAGVGSTVDVRGLPEVGTLLNGEAFITPDQIASQQPDFSTIPSELFRGADVIKSSRANLPNGGISGTIDLHTYRPWELPHGWTFGGSVNGAHGAVTDKWQPEANGLLGYNADGRWGVVLSADYSDVTRENSTTGMDQYGVVLAGENAASAGYYSGFLGAFNDAPIPSEIHRFPDGSVDVNGNGKANDAFVGSENFTAFDTQMQRRRHSFNASGQVDLGAGFSLTSDLFFTRQDQYDRNTGYEFNSTNWQGATFVPLVSRATGVPVTGQFNDGEDGWGGTTLSTTQVYKKWPGDVETYSSIGATRSVARNVNVQLDYDNGGPFTGSLRGIRSSAHQTFMSNYLQFTDSTGAEWPNDPEDAAPPGTYIYPAELGGNRVFNPNGIPQNSIPVTLDMRGTRMAATLPSALQDVLSGRDNWVLKTIASEGNYDRRSGMNIVRADGRYAFSDGFKLDFGVRNSIRSASNVGFQLNAPVYAGMGASDPEGCLVHYYAADVVLDGAGIDGACTAGNADGFFRAGVLSGLTPDHLPGIVADNFKQYHDLAGVKGVTTWGLDPRAMDDVLAFNNALYPGQQQQVNPGTTWNVFFKETSAFVQADFQGELGSIPYSGNAGVRAIRTDLRVTQHLTGDPEPYGLLSQDAGTVQTARSYHDYLPSANLALDLTSSLKLRLAYSKNMMPLNLNQWGGGLTLNYGIDTSIPGQTIFRVLGGSSDGNPSLDPWRSTNYGASLEYYINPSSMLSVAAFYIDVASFINSGSVRNCELPDQDGVVRGHCVAIFEPVQGTGNSVHGVEIDYKQGLTFLPGLLSHTGVEVNYTYSPSNSGETDLAGNSIPFQDNSKQQANLILWFQNDRFQARLAGNYRSKRAVSQNFGGVTGLEMYQAPTFYLDASASWQLAPHIQLFAQASNLTNEHERYYLVWPDQVAHTTYFERRYVVGLRARF